MTLRTLAYTLSLALHVAIYLAAARVPASAGVHAPERHYRSTRLALSSPRAPQVPSPPKVLPPPRHPTHHHRLQPAPPPEPVQEPAASLPTVAGASDEERERYLAAVLEAIERHKYYPRASRRMGEEGEVRVSLFVAPDGSVRDLNVEGEHQRFNEAALQAVRAAVPLPSPPPGEADGIQVKYLMRYDLQ